MTNIVLSAHLAILISTNWVPAGVTRTLMFPEEANTTTFHETGQISSNRLLVFEFEGKVNSLCVGSEVVGFTSRTYTERMVRDYSATTPLQIYGPVITNWGSLWITNRLQ